MIWNILNTIYFRNNHTIFIFTYFTTYLHTVSTLRSQLCKCIHSIYNTVYKVMANFILKTSPYNEIYKQVFYNSEGRFEVIMTYLCMLITLNGHRKFVNPFYWEDMTPIQVIIIHPLNMGNNYFLRNCLNLYV